MTYPSASLYSSAPATFSAAAALLAGEASQLTEVELTSRAGRRARWLRFGRPSKQRLIERRHRVVSFAPGRVFAVVRREADLHGLTAPVIDIVRAVRPGERCAAVPFVRPGGESLLRLGGGPQVEKVLQAIAAVETLGIDPADVAPEHWRHVHNRLSVGERPGSYSRSKHRAWLRRRQGLR